MTEPTIKVYELPFMTGTFMIYEPSKFCKGANGKLELLNPKAVVRLDVVPTINHEREV